ncbi:MAG: hypothetical protein MUF42_16565 [Cytophagaceae bacterium]|nr:hypothetical protein [Cytophagaceae bacterium]
MKTISVLLLLVTTLIVFNSCKKEEINENTSNIRLAVLDINSDTVFAPSGFARIKFSAAILSEAAINIRGYGIRTNNTNTSTETIQDTIFILQNFSSASTFEIIREFRKTIATTTYLSLFLLTNNGDTIHSPSYLLADIISNNYTSLPQVTLPSPYLPLAFDNNNVLLQPLRSPKSQKGDYFMGTFEKNGDQVIFTLSNPTSQNINVTSFSHSNMIQFNPIGLSLPFPALSSNTFIPFSMSGTNLDGDYFSDFKLITSNQDTFLIAGRVTKNSGIKVSVGGGAVDAQSPSITVGANSTETIRFTNTTPTSITITINFDPVYFTNAPTTTQVIAPGGFYDHVVTTGTSTGTSTVTYSFNSGNYEFAANVQ